MNNKIPDFSLWIESEADKKIALFKDGSMLMEIRTYKNKLYGDRVNDKKLQVGTSINFFGKEVLRTWNIFISDEEFIFSALMTDEGKWEIGIPISKEEAESDDSNEKKGRVSLHITGMANPYVQVSILTSNGRIERVIYKNSLPPNS